MSKPKENTNTGGMIICISPNNPPKDKWQKLTLMAVEIAMRGGNVEKAELMIDADDQLDVILSKNATASCIANATQEIEEILKKLEALSETLTCEILVGVWDAIMSARQAKPC